MIAALSPVESWVLIGVLVVGCTVLYAVLVGRDWLRRAEDLRPIDWSAVLEPQVRVQRPVIYDWDARGDFATDEELARWVWDEDEWRGYP